VQLTVAAAGLAAGCLPLLMAGSPFELGLGVALTGLAIPMILVLCSVLAEAAVHRAVLTQAFAWLNSASAAGSAGAAAAAGWAVGTFGTHGGFAVAAMAAGVTAALAVAGLLGGWFHRSAQKAEFVALGVGEYVPGFLAGLSHVGLSGAELEETL
jgi:dipeptide/tripeptide permease